MKTATLLSLFLISFLSTTLIAQNRSETVNITWGEEEKGSRQLFVSELIDADEEHVLVMKRSLKTYKTFKPGQIIARYDQDMRLDVEKELVLETNKRERELSFTTNLNDGIQVFSSFNNSKLKKHFLFVENIDKKTLSPTSSLVKIAEIDYTGNSRYRIGNFDGVLSRDESKLLVYYNLPYQKKAKEKFGFHVFDQQMNLIWNRNVTLPYRDDLFAIKDYEVDNEGNVFILGQVFTSSKHVGKGKNSKPNYKYVVLSYSSDGEDLKVYPIQVQAKFLKDMKMALDTDNNILCGGFYSMLNRGNVKGSFFLKIDADSKEITSKTFKAFGIDFITQNMSKGVAKRNKNRNSKGKNVELYDYNFDDIVLDKNGNVFLIGEQFYSYSQTVTSTNTSGLSKSSTIHYFIYNDIIVVKMSPEGEIEWAEKIAKRQKSQNDGGYYSSYILSLANDKLNFIFNDHEANLNYKGVGKVANYFQNKNSITSLVSLDKSTGKQTREALFSAREAETLISPRLSKHISDTEILLYGKKGKKYRLARLEF